jgi:hypothetical protein
VFIVELLDFPHAVHEAGELFELSLLVIGGIERDADIARLLKGGHSELSCS